MNELGFIQQIMTLQDTNERAALATVIRTKGSTPRKVGAKMLIFRNGSISGTIGGGCGEGEVIEKGLEVIESGSPVRHKVDLTKGLFYEDGGICGGIQEIFIEAIGR
ncbi:XdhC family protein [Halalkalibacter oceani]|uniref:XdhC family protein n=1 Tax=Halalkalibacter oceani TaxID=1653776 RepID=A0A9X2DUS5_9BACI|nr:XdhC family protein [Halalkalibacter oceani]MCM3715917.1 XdhC family protein [Halalkalibacter oceani]